MDQTLRLMLVDDQVLMRDGLKLLLARYDSVEVVACASTGEDAVAIYDPAAIDVVIMDTALPEMDGVSAMRSILHRHPAAKVVMLSTLETRRHIDDAMSAGARGYLAKRSATVDDVVKAAEVAWKGGAFISPQAHLALVGGTRAQNDDLAQLTERQVDVLSLLAQGLVVKQVAGVLGLSVKTIETHRAHIMERLNLHTTASLFLFAIRHGIVTAREEDRDEPVVRLAPPRCATMPSDARRKATASGT